MCSFNSNLYAQKQNYNWIFGTYAGVTWKTKQIQKVTGLFGTPDAYLADLPMNLPNSVLNTYEGVFTISDANGDLQLFSEGNTLWNKNQISLGSGLGGNNSSAQSGTIVLYPNQMNKYIVLATGQTSSNILKYSVVDMSLNNGLGQIIQTSRSFTGGQGTLGETVTAGRHSNHKDLWVIAVGRTNATHPGTNLNVWKITENNITDNSIPLHHFKHLPDVVTAPANPGGYIKFTNDTKHFAWVNFGRGTNTKVFLCYGDFDNTTGEISNVRIKKIEGFSNAAFGYGVEFTNDNEYLYISLAPDNVTGNYGSGLAVFDFNTLLNATEQTDIDSVEMVYSINTPSSDVQNAVGPFFGALQTGPDGRIYSTSLGKRALFIIDNPKEPQNLRMYRLPINNIANWGLPNFAVPWFNTGIEIPKIVNSLCSETEIDINFYIVDGEGFDKIDKISIDFGDGTTNLVYQPVVAGIHPEKHTYAMPGNYSIVVTAYNFDGTINTTFDKTVIINSCAIKVNPNIRGEFNRIN